jgi:predicted O-methyltransferase YrrM
MIKYFCCLTLFVLCVVSPDLVISAEQKPISGPDKHYNKNYNFPSDEFTRNIPVWEKALQPYKGQPDVHYLEFGVNYGRAAIWVLENILTHESAKLTGMDIFPDGLDFEEVYLSNLKTSGLGHKATTIKGYSQFELRKLPLNSFDIIYIDADHRAKAVMSDAALSWELLKNGGLIIFDDYLWHNEKLPDELLPRLAIDSFVSCYRDVLEIVHSGYQLIVRKNADSCDVLTMGCSRIGQYVYIWDYEGKHRLCYPDELDKPIELSKEERAIIQQIAVNSKFGQTTHYIEASVENNSVFKELKKRLKLDMSDIEIGKDAGFIEKLRRRFQN